MNQIEKAIIMAAGKGTRLKPITDEIPKPLIDVNGTSMIEGIIDILQKNKIFEIYVIVGYKKEKFEFLKEKYKNLKIIYNPYYDTCNNISSLYVAKEILNDNCIILDADQIIYNPNILSRDIDKSGYCCAWSEIYTNEWLLTIDENGVVTSCNINGGTNAWRLYSVSKWLKDDALKLQKYVRYEFENKNTCIYWDNLALLCYPEEFELKIYKIDKDDMIEIDSVEELVSIDQKYKKYLREVKK